MENNVPRAGFEPTSLEPWASVLIITSPNLLDDITLSKSTCLCGSLHDRSVQTTIYMVSYIYFLPTNGSIKLPVGIEPTRLPFKG